MRMLHKYTDASTVLQLLFALQLLLSLVLLDDLREVILRRESKDARMRSLYARGNGEENVPLSSC
jgi:hypothetical protein